ncbi:MAG: DUF262 domain-containing HNH endonuclease family protein [Lachnospiraceae bacterium]|nr:DUF262 domain-containing HNH endonuclease family protein [Lachnospiraceae bacterium]
MKIEGGRIINDFIEPNKRQYAIPVYQRNYEWSREQCVKLFADIVEAYKKDKTHFCGSVVYAPLKEEHNIHYYVIVDGQQRLTTIYLLLKALMDQATTESEKELLQESLFNKDKFDTYDVDTASKLKLKPIKSDNNQLYLLMDGKYDEIDKSSGIWINYTIFCDEIKSILESDGELDIKKIYKGIEKLTCAMIKLDTEDNAQEIFERINSTGVPLSLADQIRNFVLMTDADQDYLYEKYWLNIEGLVKKEQMSVFFIEYINLKKEGFTKENEAYDAFKSVFKESNFSNEEMLKDVSHYAELYHIFVNGDDKLSAETNRCLKGLNYIKQTTVYLFLFKIFDDFMTGVIEESELEKVLSFLLTYSIRRIICEVNSNSLRGLYKTLYNRVFINEDNKKYYYDAIVSFMTTLTSRDVFPDDEIFKQALINNNLYKKHALCNYLLIAIENQGKEKIQTDNLSIEHVMPQNKNISKVWQDMLGENWEYDKAKWLHTLGNLTLTGYNSELGDRPFAEKKKMIEELQTKVVILYKDIQSEDTWNVGKICARANRLADEVIKLFPLIKPEHQVEYKDPSLITLTSENYKDATYKTPFYYELLGERVNVDSYADMIRSVSRKLYELDSTVIERMAANNETFPKWTIVPFSYDTKVTSSDYKIKGTEIFISCGFSASNSMYFIRELLKIYDLDISEDFTYTAKSYKADTSEDME